MKIPTTPETRRFNALIEEFDRATGFHFDRVTNIEAMADFASVAPYVRGNLHRDLIAAASVIAPIDAAAPVCENGNVKTETFKS